MAIRWTVEKESPSVDAPGVLEVFGKSHLAAGLRLSEDEVLKEFDLCCQSAGHLRHVRLTELQGKWVAHPRTESLASKLTRTILSLGSF